MEKSVAATLIKAGPCVMAKQLKWTVTKPFRFQGEVKEKASRALASHFKKPTPQRSQSSWIYKTEDTIELGDTIGVDLFVEGEFFIVGTSKVKVSRLIVNSAPKLAWAAKLTVQHSRARHPGSSVLLLGPPGFSKRACVWPAEWEMIMMKVQNLRVIEVIFDRNLILVVAQFHQG